MCRIGHGSRQVGGFACRHAAQEDGHEERGELMAARSLVAGRAANEGVNRGRGEFLAIALGADDVDCPHWPYLLCSRTRRSATITPDSRSWGKGQSVADRAALLIAVETFFEAGPPVPYAA